MAIKEARGFSGLITLQDASIFIMAWLFDKTPIILQATQLWVGSPFLKLLEF
jgi:hypothetical protein